jgi:queuine tRNA-ribosyltransferase
MAVVPDPEHRWRVDLAKARWREADEPLLEGCPCPACAHGHSRAYLHYLLKARETTGMRLLTLHNLAYLERLMAELRAAIGAGRLAEVTAALRAGAAPWALGEWLRGASGAASDAAPARPGAPAGGRSGSA